MLKKNSVLTVTFVVPCVESLTISQKTGPLRSKSRKCVTSTIVKRDRRSWRRWETRSRETTRTRRPSKRHCDSRRVSPRVHGINSRIWEVQMTKKSTTTRLSWAWTLIAWATAPSLTENQNGFLSLTSAHSPFMWRGKTEGARPRHRDRRDPLPKCLLRMFESLMHANQCCKIMLLWRITTIRFWLRALKIHSLITKTSSHRTRVPPQSGKTTKCRWSLLRASAQLQMPAFARLCAPEHPLFSTIVSSAPTLTRTQVKSSNLRSKKKSQRYKDLSRRKRGTVIWSLREIANLKKGSRRKSNVRRRLQEEFVLSARRGLKISQTYRREGSSWITGWEILRKRNRKRPMKTTWTTSRSWRIGSYRDSRKLTKEPKRKRDRSSSA